MAIINGIYKDKGRGVELKTSILDVRIKSYPYDTDTISVDPTDEDFADVGEWVLLNASGELVRPTKSAGGTALSGAAKAVIAGATNAAAGPPYMVYSDRGAMDVQASGKIPVLKQGQKEGEFGLYVSEGSATVGEELLVMFVDGAHGGFTTATGFSGVKGVLVTMTDVITIGSLNGSFDLDGGATFNAWCVGFLTDTTAAGSGVVSAELYSSPLIKSITIA